MSEILCIYYSRTGHTRASMEEIARTLGAELAEVQDGVERGGWGGYLRCGADAVRKTCRRVRPLETRRPLEQYRLVIVGTPVWAGRCSAPIRSFLKEYGRRLRAAAYVITRKSADRNEEVFDQMDRYVPCGHAAAVSLRSGSVGYAFWQEEFLRQVREALR